MRHSVTSDRSVRIISLAQAGMRPKQIAAELDAPIYSVSGVLVAARQAGIDVPYFKHVPGGPPAKDTRQAVRISRRALAQLAPHAALRRLPVERLAARIVRAVAAGGLVDAVLDDGKGAGDA